MTDNKSTPSPDNSATVVKPVAKADSSTNNNATADTVVKPINSTTADTMVLQDDSDKTRVKIRSRRNESRNMDREVRMGDIIKERFILDRVLGAGGMGAVFRALDLRKKEAGDPRPYVALKILGEDFKNHPQALVTLQREARKTQDLAHPNIVTVYDFDRDGDLIYMTMEELKGRSLAEVLIDRSHHLTFDEKMGMLFDIAKGLAHAHSKGLVHSDLKPGNVFVTENNHIKIVDFGIARAANSSLYEDGFDAGELGAVTVSYASPEMLRFESPHPSDDVYALGIIACELFNGKHPYGGKSAQYVYEQNLSSLDQKSAAPKVPIFKPTIPKFKNPLLKKVIMRSLELERDRRIPDASQFLKELRSARSTPRRLAVVFTVLCIALVVNFFYLQQVTPTAIKLADLPVAEQTSFNNYIKEADVAMGFGDFQAAVFNVDQAYKIHQTDESLLTIRDKILQIANQNLANAKSPEDKMFYEEQLKQLKVYPAFADPK